MPKQVMQQHLAQTKALNNQTRKILLTNQNNFNMNEIIKMVSQKTGISEPMAKMAVDVVISQLKTKLPAGVGNQIEDLLNGKGANAAGNILEDVAGKLGGMFGKK